MPPVTVVAIVAFAPSAAAVVAPSTKLMTGGAPGGATLTVAVATVPLASRAVTCTWTALAARGTVTRATADVAFASGVAAPWVCDHRYVTLPTPPVVWATSAMGLPAGAISSGAPAILTLRAMGALPLGST